MRPHNEAWTGQMGSAKRRGGQGETAGEGGSGMESNVLWAKPQSLAIDPRKEKKRTELGLELYQRLLLEAFGPKRETTLNLTGRPALGIQLGANGAGAHAECGLPCTSFPLSAQMAERSTLERLEDAGLHASSDVSTASMSGDDESSGSEVQTFPTEARTSEAHEVASVLVDYACAAKESEDRQRSASQQAAHGKATPLRELAEDSAAPQQPVAADVPSATPPVAGRHSVTSELAAFDAHVQTVITNLALQRAQLLAKQEGLASADSSAADSPLVSQPIASQQAPSQLLPAFPLIASQPVQSQPLGVSPPSVQQQQQQQQQGWCHQPQWRWQ